MPATTINTTNRAHRPHRNVVLSALLLNSLAFHTLSLECIAADEPTLESAALRRDVASLTKKYCIGCHGPTRQKADRRFDTLPHRIDSDDTLVDYQDILDQLNLGAMPPEGERQPTDSERRVAIATLTNAIKTYHQRRAGAAQQAALRRLNAREYRNSIRDLFSVDTRMFDPTVGFPRDQLTQHLDNIGDTLVTSGHQLASYLSAADLTIEKILADIEQPPRQVWRFTDNFRQQPEIDQVHRKTNQFKFITLYEVVGADKHEGAYGHIHDFAAGVPYDGFYDIRIKAEALNREHPYDPKLLGTDSAEPLRLGIRAGHQLAGPLHKPQPIEPLLTERDLQDGTHQYTLRVWLDRGFTPRFTYQNGTIEARSLWGKIVNRYKDQFPPKQRGGIVEHRYNAIAYGKIPQIRIHEVEIEGPFFDAWPPPRLRAVLGEHWEHVQGNPADFPPARMRQQLTNVARRVYRRPATDQELDRVMQVVQDRLDAGRTPLQAYGDGLKVLLCSPSFLYLDTSTFDDGRLTPNALASRLSYFLWSSTPDERLLQLAENGSLDSREVLAAEVERMLQDPRSDAWVNGVLDSWLTLRDLGSTPPDRRDFLAYYRDDLLTAMRRETSLFTRHMLEENANIELFLNADFSFVNNRLARLYGIDGVSGPEFQRVSLAEAQRGGLLGQASILTVTANGVETSPVVRGVWVLENLLGTPPSPPPPDVEPLDPDVRGAQSIRERLAKHRSHASCNECHRKIDPIGFALENFDPIGRWRDSYDRQVKIDAAGELPGGHQFSGVREFRALLAQQQKQFATALTTKLLEYASGRKMTALDRPAVDKIVTDLAEQGNGLRDLVQLVVASDVFLSP